MPVQSTCRIVDSSLFSMFGIHPIAKVSCCRRRLECVVENDGGVGGHIELQPRLNIFKHYSYFCGCCRIIKSINQTCSVDISRSVCFTR